MSFVIGQRFLFAAQAPSAPDGYDGFLLPGAFGGAAVGDGDLGSDEGIKV